MESSVSPDPTSKKLTGNPDANAFVEATTAPLKAVRLRTGGPVDGIANLMISYDPQTGAFSQATLINPATGQAEAQRTMTKIIPSGLIANIGATAVWTPAAGKRFRLMGFSVILRGDTTTAAGSLVTLLDNATPIDDVLYMGTTNTNPQIRNPSPLPGNGYLSAAVGNVLNVNLSAAATAGGLYINVWGTEE